MSIPPGTLPPELNPRGPGPKRPGRPSRPARTTGGPAASRSTSQHWVRVVAGVTAASVVGFSIVGTALASHYEGQLGRVALNNGPAATTDSAQNFLLVGSDLREGLTRAQISQMHLGAASAANGAGSRSDTMILLHISPNQDKATLVSLPRDSFVQIPAYTDRAGKRHAASHNKLNASYELGGAALTVQTVELATGLHVDHYIEIGFGGFVNMVDALGGIDVCSPRAVKDPKSGLNLKAGINSLDGVRALGYVRARYIDPTADLGRMRRQQQFLGTIFRKATSTGTLFDPLKLNNFLSATAKSITVDDSLTHDDLVNLALKTKGLAPSNVVFTTVPLSNVNYSADGVRGAVLWAASRSAALFDSLRKDQPIGSQTNTSPSATTAAGTTVIVSPSRITVQVENGGSVAGAGSKAANDLAAMKFVSAGPAKNSDHTGVTSTLILYDPGFDQSLKTLQAAFPDAQVQSVKGQGKVFRVIVGSGYAAPHAVIVSAASSSAGAGTGSSTDVSRLTTQSAADTACKL